MALNYYVYFNQTGVEGNPKLFSLHHLFENMHPNVILIQETMVCGDKAYSFFIRQLKD